jgi:hypothetical membrane protein
MPGATERWHISTVITHQQEAPPMADPGPGRAEATAQSETERRLLSASTWAGVGAPAITVVGILVATLLSPDFGWTANALSDLGSVAPDATAATATTRLLFNGGLLAGGIVGLGFGPALLVAYRNLVELLGVGLAGLTLVTMGLIGVFPLPTEEHLLVAVPFFVLLSVALTVYGAGNVVAGARRRGLATIGFAGLSTGAWTVWALTGPFFRPGLALPEAVGAGLLGVWAVWTVRDVQTRVGLR